MIFGQLQSQKGFSFVEQVIVLAIIALLSVTAIFTFSNITIKQKHIAARDEFIFNLRKIQNYSMTGRKVGESVPQYFGIKIKDKQNYILFADVNGDQVYEESDDMLLDQVEIDENLRLAPGLGTFLSIVPSGSFCYHTNEIAPVVSDCSTERVQQILVDSTSVGYDVFVDTVLGDISFE